MDTLVAAAVCLIILAIGLRLLGKDTDL